MWIVFRRDRIIWLLVMLIGLSSNSCTPTPTLIIATLSPEIHAWIEPQELKRGDIAQIKTCVEIGFGGQTDSEKLTVAASVQPDNGLKFVRGPVKLEIERRKGVWARRSLSMWPGEKRRTEFWIAVDPNIEIGLYKIKIQVTRNADSSAISNIELILTVTE
ncbi:MAG: hypothetical protein ACOYZ7_18900 [Chloroflexota bacterium]